MAPNELPDLNRPPQEDEQLTHKVQENQNEKQSEQQTVPDSESPQDEEEENQNEKQSEQQTVPESESPQDEEEENQNEKQSEQQTVPDSESPQDEEEENQNEKQSERQTVPESESPQDEEEKNQNEKQSEQQTVPESESPQDEEEEVVKDTTCVSDDQTMTTPCVPNPSTPTTPPPPPPPTTREPPHPHCSSFPDKYCGFETLFFGSYSDTHLGSPVASGFVTEPSCEPIEDVVSPQPEKPTSSKRRLMPVFGKNADESREKRKAKAVEEEAAAKKKKKPSAGAATRVWSEEDEVVILKGLMNFQPKKGSNSCQDHWGELYELIKKSLSDYFSKSQFTDKIYKLRRKYRKNAYKGERADEHEHECFELSKRIWGGGGRAMSTRARKTVKQLDKSVALPEENGKEVAWKELEKKWQIWSADEAALRLRLDELIQEQKKLMFDALKPSKGVRFCRM